jgi:hypothetical protein
LVSIDGSTVADEKGNNEAFGSRGASRGTGAHPQIRFVSLVENGISSAGQVNYQSDDQQSR